MKRAVCNRTLILKTTIEGHFGRFSATRKSVTYFRKTHPQIWREYIEIGVPNALTQERVFHRLKRQSARKIDSWEIFVRMDI